MWANAIATRVVPARYLLPLRYHWRRVRGVLEPEMRYLPEVVRAGSVAVDIGANVGVYSYILARLGASVEAFEPVPACADQIAAYGSPNIKVHRVALSATPGTRELRIPLTAGRLRETRATLEPISGPARSIGVATATLDSFCFRDVSFMKVDVEGHELDALRGAVDTITRTRPVLLIEVEQWRLSFPMQEVFRFVENLGYRGIFLDRGRVRPLGAFSPSEHQQSGASATTFINNFLFFPADTEAS